MHRREIHRYLTSGSVVSTADLHDIAAESGRPLPRKQTGRALPVILCHSFVGSAAVQTLLAVAEEQMLTRHHPQPVPQSPLNLLRYDALPLRGLVERTLALVEAKAYRLKAGLRRIHFHLLYVTAQWNPNAPVVTRYHSNLNRTRQAP